MFITILNIFRLKSRETLNLLFIPDYKLFIHLINYIINL